MDTSTTDFAESAADNRITPEMYSALRRSAAEDAATAKTSQLQNKVTETFQGMTQGVLNFLTKGGQDSGAIFSMGFAAVKFLEASMQNFLHSRSVKASNPAQTEATHDSIALKLGNP